jgi:hypothetical protein
MSNSESGVVASNVRRIGHLDIPGGGQVVVQGKRAYVGHMDPPHGTSIVDISDLSKPRILSTLEVPPDNHSHKVRVSGHIMLINNEAHRRHQMWGGAKIPATRAKEVGYYIPAPGAGQKTVQSNDVFLDDNGIIYLMDRLNGLDILEYTGPAGQKAAA